MRPAPPLLLLLPRWLNPLVVRLERSKAAGLGLTDVRKNTMMMLRPGACLTSKPSSSFLGHAIAMGQFLSQASVKDLRARDIELIHPAFGLAVSAKFDLDSIR